MRTTIVIAVDHPVSEQFIWETFKKSIEATWEPLREHLLQTTKYGSIGIEYHLLDPKKIEEIKEILHVQSE